MKKYMVILIFAALLCGCAETDSHASVSVQTAENPIETAAGSESHEQDAPVTFPVFPDDDPYEIKKRYTFDVQSDGVTVYYDKHEIQFLEADCRWADKEDWYNQQELTYSDFNFDSYSDLFIPEELGKTDRHGKYFRFNPETGLFAPWNEMNQLGIVSYPNGAKATLSTFSCSSDIIDTKRYHWENDILVLERREYQYQTNQTNDGKTYIVDYFTYANGYEELYQRSQLFYPNGSEWPEVTELPLT